MPTLCPFSTVQLHCSAFHHREGSSLEVKGHTSNPEVLVSKPAGVLCCVLEQADLLSITFKFNLIFPKWQCHGSQMVILQYYFSMYKCLFWTRKISIKIALYLVFVVDMRELPAHRYPWRKPWINSCHLLTSIFYI